MIGRRGRLLAGVMALGACWGARTAGAQDAGGVQPASAPAALAPAAVDPAQVASAPASPPAPTSASSDPPQSLPPVTLELLHAALSSWGCEASDVLEIAGRWYAACGAGGVYIVERRGGSLLVLSGRRQGSGEARSLFMRGGSLWVESARVEAHPLADLPPVAVSAGGQLPGASERASKPASTGLAPAAPPAQEHASPESLVAPRRLGGMLALEAAAQPFLPIATLSFAALLDFAATYYGQSAWFVQGRLFPLGGLVGRGAEQRLFGAMASAGYDHQLFAVGLGVGVLRHGAGHALRCDFNGCFVDESDQLGFVLGQQARLGALDGLHMRLTTTFVLDDDRWRFGMLDMKLQVPLNARTWLVAGGAGGQQAAFFSGELGLRRLLRGRRDDGALFLRPAVGLAGVDPRVDAVAIGPMVSMHLEWRP